MQKLFTHLVLILACVFLIPSVAFAHTKLESSNPGPDEQVKTEVSQIEMLFNSSIETLSTFSVKNSTNQTIEVHDVTVQDHKMTGSFDNALAEGTYTVDWKIVGKDGHPIKGTYSFQVLTPPQSPSIDTKADPTVQDSTNNTQNKSSQDSVESSSASNVVSEQAAIATENQADKNNQEAADSEPAPDKRLLYYGIPSAIIIVIMLLFIVKGRRRN